MKERLEAVLITGKHNSDLHLRTIKEKGESVMNKKKDRKKAKNIPNRIAKDEVLSQRGEKARK